MASAPPPYSVGASQWPGAAKVLEECAELVQLLAKLVASVDGETSWSGAHLRPAITDEVADLQAALTYLIVKNTLHTSVRRSEKLAQLWAADRDMESDR